jgi:hypothetical protein
VYDHAGRAFTLLGDSDRGALPFEVSSRRTSGRLSYEQDQQKKSNPEPFDPER